ncbi:hypothetical protein FACS1894152_8100 [Bacilli bacterium]|nr:hypothetical protein FACS1894152_8100 [Bacilli bacterium]
MNSNNRIACFLIISGFFVCAGTGTVRASSGAKDLANWIIGVAGNNIEPEDADNMVSGFANGLRTASHGFGTDLLIASGAVLLWETGQYVYRNYNSETGLTGLVDTVGKDAKEVATWAWGKTTSTWNSTEGARTWAWGKTKGFFIWIGGNYKWAWDESRAWLKSGSVSGTEEVNGSEVANDSEDINDSEDSNTTCNSLR